MGTVPKKMYSQGHARNENFLICQIYVMEAKDVQRCLDALIICSS